MTNELMSTFNAGTASMGILISFFYYSYTAMQLPCGFIIDRIGPRNLLGISATLCVIGSFIFALTDNINIAKIGRFLVGSGSACSFISCLQISAHMFPKRHFVILTGITNVMGTLGGLVGGVPIAKIVNVYGWQTTTNILAICGIFIGLLIVFFIPKRIESQSEQQSKSSVLTAFVSIAKNKQVLLAGLIAGLMYLPIDVFAELWAVPYFMVKYNISNEYAAISSSIIFVGVAIGSVAMAIFAEKIHSYKKTLQLSAGVLMLLFSALLFSNQKILTAFIMVFLIGFFTGAQPIGFTCAKENVQPNKTGAAISITNCIVMLIGAIFQPLIGVLLDIFGNEKNTHAYDINSYNAALMLIPISLAISVICSSKIKESN
ncbi:MAG: MFS transporter [Alphaproteobacteria bacterium]|nr:MFS transporter [Alphaproteobacteria bacterium]